jgi:hypothetical protein
MMQIKVDKAINRLEFAGPLTSSFSQAYRVLKPGGTACMIGPVHPTFPLSRFFADAWMLFPTEQEVKHAHVLISQCMRALKFLASGINVMFVRCLL